MRASTSRYWELMLWGSLGLWAFGCNRAPEATSFPLEVQVRDDRGQGLSGVEVLVDGSVVGITGPEGSFKGSLSRLPGEVVELSARALVGFEAVGVASARAVLGVDPATGQAVAAQLQTVMRSLGHRYLLWVKAPCPSSPCEARKVSVDNIVVAQTSVVGLAHFVIARPEGGVIRVGLDQEEGALEVSLGQRDEIVVVDLTARGEAVAQEEAGEGAEAVEEEPVAKARPKGKAPGKRVAMASDAQVRRATRGSYRGGFTAKAFRDVLVQSDPPGSYLYVDDKRSGEVGSEGLLIQKMPVGDHRFVLKMPANATVFLPPVKRVIEVVEGKGTQLIEMNFSRSLNVVSALRKKVDEGGRLSPAETKKLEAVAVSDPSYGVAMGVLVTSHERQKQYAKAQVVLEKMAATSKYSVDPEVYSHLARLAVAQGKYVQALNHLVQMERYINQYKSKDRGRKMAEMYKLRAKIHARMFSASRGRRPDELDRSTRDWQAYINLVESPAAKEAAQEEIRKNNERLGKTKR